MTSPSRAFLTLVLCLTLAALACSLPGRLLRSAASEAVDAIREATDEVELPDQEDEQDDSGSPPNPSDMIGGLLGDIPTSPPYDIYVGANVTGNCGAFTNSGGFASLTFDSVFHGIRFSPPSEDNLPGPYGGISQEGGVPIPVVGMGLMGEGELGTFTFCPMYEPESHPCSVTEGPSPFEPSLRIGAGESGVPVVPLVGTPVPSGGGEALLIYSIGSTSDLSPIMVWDCEIGTGALGGSLSPVQVAFPTSWDRLMQGEAFTLGAISDLDEGEVWEWTIRFVPAE